MCWSAQCVACVTGFMPYSVSWVGGFVELPTQVLTPVRRSTRKQTRHTEDRAALLEITNYAYTPNTALTPTPNTTSKKHPTDVQGGKKLEF